MSKEEIPSTFLELLSTASEELKIKMHEALLSASSPASKKIFLNSLKNDDSINCDLSPNSTLPPEEYVKYIHEFTSDNDTLQNLLKELEDLNLPVSDGVSSQWLS